MRIILPGKFNQNDILVVCRQCSCNFVANKNTDLKPLEGTTPYTIDTKIVECPECQQIHYIHQPHIIL